MKTKNRKQKGGFFMGLSLLGSLLKGGGLVKKKRKRRGKNTINKCRCKKVFIE